MDRRSFFGVLAGAAGALQANLALTNEPTQNLNMSVTSMPDSARKISMGQYTIDAFASRIGHVFSFHRTADANDPPVHLELVDVKSSPHQSPADARQPFSLLFALRSGDPAHESTLHLRHDEFEPCAWFVNRVIAPEREHHMAYYEAVFA